MTHDAATTVQKRHLYEDGDGANAWKRLRTLVDALRTLADTDHNVEKRTPSAEHSAIGRLHGTTKKDITCSMKGEERIDSTMKRELTRALTKERVIKINKMECNHKAKWYLYKEHAGNKHQKRRRRNATTRLDVLGTMTVQGHALSKTE